MVLGKKIKELRLKKCLSQTDLGRLAGIPQTTISDWENSKSLPNIKDAEKIAAALGITLIELVQKGR
ncbi:helix-turn-helix transcriptional regulator [bacterium AH-315-E09]|nr:helix-turn-helix transcriptional regulator [Alkaliphilus sp. AH-315-G20]MBN4074652.1 helix-turn-helix transcriptional regulator [bacterium AH-315-E09]